MKHTVLIIDGVKTVATVMHDGEIYQAVADHHPNFNQIIARLEADPTDESVIDLFDIEKTVKVAFEKVSERITIRNGEVYFDGDLLHNGVSKQIMRFVSEGLTDKLQAVANFTEKVMTNPQEHSRDQLFTWLERHDFTITSNGDFVGYKGCNAGHDGVPVSSRPAPAKDKVTVNGVEVSGKPVPNNPGDVVEMPRSLVDFNAYVGCSTGLHVGTYSYASSFAPVLLEVHVNPRDVVSVPTDCDAQKIRTCRYTVVGPIENEYASAWTASDYDDEDDEFLDDEDIEAEAEEAAQAAYDAVWDTRLNYTKQVRGADGKFLPKTN